MNRKQGEEDKFLHTPQQNQEDIKVINIKKFSPETRANKSLQERKRMWLAEMFSCKMALFVAESPCPTGVRQYCGLVANVVARSHEATSPIYLPWWISDVES